MKLLASLLKTPLGLVCVLLTAFVAGCGGGGLDPILGNPGAGMLPTVSATSPEAKTPGVTGVATNSRVYATFSKPMAANTITAASFKLACPAGAPVAASVVYDPATQVATLIPAAALPASTPCVATILGSVKDSAGFAMGSDFVWGFTTAPLADTTRPTVTNTVPPGAAIAVANNTRISASFSEDMDPTTISGTSFTLANSTLGTSIAGTVSYSVASKTATFTPTTPVLLASNSLFTATLTSAATDLAGNALAGNAAALPAASNYVWSFTTGSVGDTIAPTVTAISPLDGATTVCLGKTVSATFSEAMDASTINSTSLRVTDAGIAVAGSVSYDPGNRVASFVPSAGAGFAAGKAFVVTVKGGSAGVRDLAGNALAADRVWGFTSGTLACAGVVVNLGAAGSFGAFGGGAGVTNQGVNTVVNGNLGTTAACTLMTGFHDAANVYTQTPLNIGAVNGSIFCAPPAPGTASSMAIATQARADAQSAYNALAALPPGSDPGAGQLGGLVLAAAVYTAAGGTFAITSGDLTLDAQGNADAVWVFQSAAALTVGLSATPRRVVLVNGARAARVFWQVGSAARIEDGSSMVGTIIAPAGVTISTAGQTAQTTLTGRAIGLVASVTMVNTTIVAP